MNILMGFKDLAQGQQVCGLIRGLDFAEPQLSLLYVAEVWGSGISGIEPTPFNYEAYLKAIEDYARRAMRELADDAQKLGIANVSANIHFGNAANELLDFVDAKGFEILALGTSDHSGIEHILAGGVVRKAVANCKASLLIAKGKSNGRQGISIVLATDHSPYSVRWIDRFVRWAPKGIRHITVVAVLPEKILEPLPASLGHLDVSHWVRESMETENKRVLEKLAALDVPCTSRVEVGNVNLVLDKVMDQSKADLLVLGSQGHGFLERLTIGSISMEQAVRHPHSVLIVRG